MIKTARDTCLEANASSVAIYSTAYFHCHMDSNIGLNQPEGMQELISKGFNLGSRAGCGGKLGLGHSTRHSAPTRGQGQVGKSGHRLGSGARPVMETGVRPD